MVNQSMMRAKRENLHWLHTKMTGDTVIRPTEIDQAHKFSGTDRPGPEVIARPQQSNLNVVSLKRIVHHDLDLGNMRLVEPQSCNCLTDLCVTMRTQG